MLPAGSVAASSGQSGVYVGNSTTAANLVVLQLSSDSNFNSDESSGTNCTAAINQGALYFNTASQAIRSCVNGNWEDVVTESGLGLLLYGIIPDSPATLGQGDLAGADGYNSGPCKVYLTATANVVGWNSCTAYSSGRKILVTAGTATVSGTASLWQNLCLTGAGDQPQLYGTAATPETTAALFPPFNVAAPVLCLAEIKTATTAGKVADIYDTRVFTTDTKTFATINTTSLALGAMVANNGTIGQYIPDASVTSQIGGVVVAYSGSTSATLPNAVIVTNGPVAVKSTAGSDGGIIEWSAAAGYGLTTAAATTATNPYTYAGVAMNAYSGVAAGCTVSTVCNGSLFTNLQIR